MRLRAVLGDPTPKFASVCHKIDDRAVVSLNDDTGRAEFGKVFAASMGGVRTRVDRNSDLAGVPLWNVKSPTSKKH